MTRKNVCVTRSATGTLYTLSGVDGKAVICLTNEEWAALGLKPLAKGATVIVDLQVSGVPKRKRTTRKK